MNHKDYKITYYKKCEKIVSCTTVEMAEREALDLMKGLKSENDPLFEPSYQLHSIVEVVDEVPLPVQEV